MKLTIRTQEIVKALYRTQGIADIRSTQAILSHVLLSATTDGVLTVSATDQDVGLSGRYEAEVEKSGSIAIQARQLYDVVKALNTESLCIEERSGHWIQIESGSGKYRLAGLSGDEFPSLAVHDEIPTSRMPAKELLQMIDRTLFCVSQNDKRHNLGGVYCTKETENTLRFVATDGHRLAMVEKEFDDLKGFEQGAIVPRKGFQELRRVLSNMEELDIVELGFSGSSGILKAGPVVLSTRLIEGSFPDYKQVIPQSTSKCAKISRQALQESLKRVSVLSRANGVRLLFDNNKLELVGEDPEFGRANEVIEIDYPHEELNIGFNARYILDILSHIRDEGIAFSLSDRLSPGIITPIEEKGFLAVVMPMRT
jgi:DNA polymerase III subunit beta